MLRRSGASYFDQRSYLYNSSTLIISSQHTYTLKSAVQLVAVRQPSFRANQQQLCASSCASLVTKLFLVHTTVYLMSWNTVKKSFLSLGNLPKRKTKDTCAWKNQGSHLVSLSYLLLVLPMSQSRVITVPSAGLNAPRRQILQSSFNSTWHGTILDSYAVAEQLLNSAGISRDQRSDRIFIPVPSFRRGWLCRLVTSYSKNVAPTNPSDLFVFSPHNRAEEIFRSACTAGIPPQMTLHFMPLREHWSTPSGTAADASLWSLPTFLSEYRQMVRH